MGKIIVENRTDSPMAEVLNRVALIVNGGRVSDDGKQYCYVTTFQGGMVIVASRNAKSDRLVATYDARIAEMYAADLGRMA